MTEPCKANTVELLRHTAECVRRAGGSDAELLERAATLIQQMQDQGYEQTKQIEALQSRLDTGLEHLKWMTSMLANVKCIQNCDSGAVPDGRGGCYECEWCGRQRSAVEFIESQGSAVEGRGPDEHPEMWCSDCGRPNIVWFAQNKLWNQVMGSPNGIVCPACFAIRAERAGVYGVWKLELHDALAVEGHGPECECNSCYSKRFRESLERDARGKR